MSRRKQSHPRAWKETVESKQRESEDAADSCQQEMSSSDCIRGNTHQEEVMDNSLSCKFIEALQHATVGQTLGPISPSVCQIVTVSIAESDEKSERAKSDDVVTSLRLQGTNGEEECVDFVSAADRDEAHIMINRTDHGIYVKLMKRFENASGIRGLVVDGEPKPSAGGEDVREIKQEMVERLTGHKPSVTSESSRSDEEQVANVTKKCPNCSVCFRNTGNLAAHQMYYCTGIDRKDPKADGRSGPKSHSASRSSSPRLLLRSPSGSSADGGSPDAPSVHVCQLCQSSFMSRQNCESHMLILHCGEHVPICKFCNFVAQSWEVLREHVFTHVKVERRDDRDGEATVDSKEYARLSEGSDGGRASDSATAIKVQFRSRLHHLHKRLGEESTVVSAASEVDQIAFHRDKVNSKRKSSSSREMNKRACWGDLTDRRTPPDSRSSDPTVMKKFSLGEPSAIEVSATMCHACNICFRSKENYVAHKKYYCKQRHSDQHETKEEASGSREGSPESSRPLPTVIHRESPHSSSSPSQYDDKERNILPERVDRPMKGPPHAPLMYMSSVVPSAMLVGGTQLISPNGAHLISPIFLLTPPVAIPVAGVEPSLPTPASDRLWKRKDRGDSPLDLSVRSSPSTPENIQQHPRVGEDAHDNTKVQSPRSPGSASPKKSFACNQCGVSFWKANTLIAHKQLYCTEGKKDGGSSSRHSEERHTTLPIQSDLSESSPFHDSPSRVNVERTSNLEHERHRLLSSSPHSFPNYSRHDEHLEKYFTSFHLENQIYKGLHLCSGCGVAFRKLESLEIHQKFYCQKSSSPAAVKRSPREVGFGNRRENANPSEDRARSPMERNITQMGDETPERNTDIHPRHTRVVDQPDDHETRVRAKPCRKERNGRQSLEIQTTRSWSPNKDTHQRARSWPTMVEQRVADDDVPLVPEGGGLRINIKKEKSESEFFHDKVSQSGSRENVIKANGLIPIKTEAASPRSSDSTSASTSASRDKTKQETWLSNGKVSRPMSIIGGVRPFDATFLPGVKSCRSCNISFHSLSTFIAHKKYYCSSVTSQRSKLPT